MPSYVVSASYFFRELGRRVEPGDTVELPEVSYQRYRIAHPGLLMPAPHNAMGRPDMIRAEAAAEAAPVVETPTEPAAIEQAAEPAPEAEAPAVPAEAAREVEAPEPEKPAEETPPAPEPKAAKKSSRAKK